MDSEGDDSEDTKEVEIVETTASGLLSLLIADRFAEPTKTTAQAKVRQT
jgi:hypothetical protein